MSPNKLADDLYSASEKYFDYRDRLEDICAPTLIVVGEHDWFCPVEHSRLMHDSIPGSELLIVPDAGHSVHLEKNGIVLQAIRNFLLKPFCVVR
jgi:proline iminopeptidase